METSLEVFSGKVLYGIIKAFFEDLWKNRDRLSEKARNLLEKLRGIEEEPKKEKELTKAIKEEPEAIEEIAKFIAERTQYSLFSLLTQLKEGTLTYLKSFNRLEDFVKRVLLEVGWELIEFESNPFSKLKDLKTICDRSGFHFQIKGYRCPIIIRGRTTYFHVPSVKVAEPFAAEMRGTRLLKEELYGRLELGEGRRRS